jgi:hypothetical protein
VLRRLFLDALQNIEGEGPKDIAPVKNKLDYLLEIGTINA